MQSLSISAVKKGPVGKRCRLNEEGVSRCFPGQPELRTRLGTVTGVGRDGYSYLILWDGLKYRRPYSIDFVELLEN